MNLLWEGPDPQDKTACPYSVNFTCRPAPAESLNSLEAGRLLFQIKLGSRVKSVKVTLTNNVKRQHLKGTDPSELEHKTTISASLTRNANTTRWNGELAIPSTWTEGGTRTYERTGAASPKIESNLYTLEVAYALDNGNNCTARFSSEDAFHWVSRA